MAVHTDEISSYLVTIHTGPEYVKLYGYAITEAAYGSKAFRKQILLVVLMHDFNGSHRTTKINPNLCNGLSFNTSGWVTLLKCIATTLQLWQSIHFGCRLMRGSNRGNSTRRFATCKQLQQHFYHDYNYHLHGTLEVGTYSWRCLHPVQPISTGCRCPSTKRTDKHRSVSRCYWHTRMGDIASKH